MSAVIELTEPSEREKWKRAARDLFDFKIKEGYQPVGLHPYRAADGSILYARVRMHKPTAEGQHEKLVRPFWHDGARWTHGEPPAPPTGKVLYGLCDALAAPDALLIIAEGEQKADALTKIGDGRVVGVTSGGATSAGTADWSPLAGRHALLWPDHDAPGAKYADEVEAKLEPHGCTVERLDVAAMGLPKAGDVVDWIEAFKAAHDRMPTAHEVLALPKVSAPPACVPEAEATGGDDAQPETDDEAIGRLAVLKPMQYDRVRKGEAKRMGVQVSTLDKLVAVARTEGGDGDESPFDTVEPWHAPVDGAALLDELVRIVQRFIVCDAATAHGTALWITMTWLMDSVDVAPIAAITAPEKRCGKSQLLFLMGRLSSRPLAASNITPAALFRAIEAWRPTLLIDEADAFMRENEELRGLLNCGHTRDSAYVVRTVGDNHTPKQFFVWGAKAIAGIGHLADTLMDRSVTLELRRKLPHEQVDKLRHAERGLFERLRAKVARWADDNEDAVRAARPALPDVLHDRAADNWEPLFQIAEIAGGAWPETARRAAIKLSGSEGQSQSAGGELLADIQEVFDTRNVQRIASADLLGYLCDDDEKPWATWNRGKPMSPRQLSKKLSEYGVASGNIKFAYGDVRKGYRIEQFADAFSRYLSATPRLSATPPPPSNREGLTVADSASGSATGKPAATPKPLSDKAGSGVADSKGETVEGGKSVTDDEAEYEL
ncbi:DUF3631 domain-containing protein [Trinickia sp. Y13]|uniref:DUF3631 domain-containing protein n=1 Tax=Trinickia sp. Y13 TaxID=2917807 RepID=UPI0024058A19|nr:DUF3631 domain-containing protein [Trinickia sp. Y13]MDG0025951.1 DUF3631 domain-containing protein [Trinickia sp. Y13]